jgi:hypothetical protein
MIRDKEAMFQMTFLKKMIFFASFFYILDRSDVQISKISFF